METESWVTMPRVMVVAMAAVIVMSGKRCCENVARFIYVGSSDRGGSVWTLPWVL